MSNLSLYTVSATLILGNEGQRLYAKYYRTEDPQQVYKTPAQQEKFERAVYSKINKMNQDVLLYDNHVITYRQTNDVILVIVGAINENESMLYTLTSNINEALLILLNNSLDKSTVLEKYDMVCLCVDEAIEDGIILEIDPAILVSRVTNPPSNSVVGGDIHMDIGERSIFNVLSFGAKKLSERLQQGL